MSHVYKSGKAPSQLITTPVKLLIHSNKPLRLKCHNTHYAGHNTKSLSYGKSFWKQQRLSKNGTLDCFLNRLADSSFKIAFKEVQQQQIFWLLVYYLWFFSAHNHHITSKPKLMKTCKSRKLFETLLFAFFF